MPGPSLGINLGAIVDWSTAFPFIDQFKLSRPWLTQEQGVWDSHEAHLLDLDAQGWVKGFTQNGAPAPFKNVATVWATAGDQMREGHYVIDWKGEGSLDVGGAQVLSRSANRLVVDMSGDTAWLTISSTDPDRTGDYIRDIRIYHESDKALLDAGEIFNPAFLEKIEDFRVLRFMDWMDTNNSTVRTWADATPIGSPWQSAWDPGVGASVDVMVALANKVGADPWFTIPHGADANYIRQFATYVREHLDPDLRARFEYSNEVWNWGFQQAQWAQKQAQNAWGANVEGGWMQWYGVKAAEMANIVADVYGAETGTRALNVFSTQAGWLGLENYALETRSHVAAGGTAPRDAPFHVYAIAPYFSGGIGSQEMVGQVNTWISQGEAGYKAALDWLRNSVDETASMVAYHAAVAKREGWQLEAYEGGQHVVDAAGLFGGGQDPAHTTFFTTLVDRPEMEQIYLRYFDMWKNNGGGMMAHFSDFGAGDRYGSWGIWDSAYSGDTSRARAVETFRDTVDAWWADSRPASVFDGGAGTPISDDGMVRTLVGTAGDDIFLVSRTGTVVLAGAGDDVVRSSASWSMSAGLEVLQLTGTGAINGAGTAGADMILGNDAANILTGLGGDDALGGDGGDDTLQGGDGRDRLLGGAGRDRLEGGAGTDALEGGGDNDIYVVSNTGDVIVELEDGGAADLVRTGLSITLAANVEELQLTGTAAVNGAGNSGANRITGNAAANILTGAAGHDVLKGGAGIDRIGGGTGDDELDGGAARDLLRGGTGNDSFLFSSLAEAGDTIADFRNLSGDNDGFRFTAAGFGGGLPVGTLAASRFQIRTDNRAQDADDRFILRTTDKTLWFDGNGDVAGGAVMVADLDAAATLAYVDILMV